MLKGSDIQLRALEPEDLDFLYGVENNENFWQLGETQIPFSRYMLRQYIENAHQDIYQAKQFRWVIDFQGKAVGCIDLYDFHPYHKRAGVGIVLLEEHQGKSWAYQALALLIEYSKKHLSLYQLFAYIDEENRKSCRLFEKSGFIKTGVKKDWLFSLDRFKNQITYQKIL